MHCDRRPNRLCVCYRHGIHIMRTNIVIDSELMDEAMRASGARTKKQAVELGLRALVTLERQQEIRRLRGKLHWEGDLAAMRLDK